ncbi:MAG TPA: hypothetical protein VGK73_01120 [Polyangiaceae bacterium]
MGWLRDIMVEADPPVRSLDQLAIQCLSFDRWPDSARMQHRSLGAIFGKLDRDENLEWLTGRPDVQSALAHVLGVELDAILVSLKSSRGRRVGRWLAWEAMPFARGMDLVEEDLFPGIPREVLHPGSWHRLIWVAPNGSGRSLTGSWLEARGLARHTRAAELDLELVPAGRPLLLELGARGGETGSERRRGQADGFGLGTGICLAVPEEIPGAEADGWRVVRSPPIGELLEPLVRWARDRLAASSRVEVAALVMTLRGAVERGVVQSAGDVLGLVGLVDTLGFNSFELSALRALAREWFKRRVGERLDRDAPGTAWMRRTGFDALVALCRRVATDAEESLFYPRTLEEWSDLLPSELRHGVDLDWLKVALPRADPSVRVTDLERASEKLPPGAFRILRAFERLGLLERDGEDLLALRPHWLIRAAFDAALEELVAGPAFDWGEALLSPSMAPITAERLLARARLGGIPHEELVDPDAVGDPAYAAASEGALRATGVSVLLGTAVPSESLEPLWDEQLRIVVELPGELALPRVDCALPPGGERGAWLFDRGIWYLAALAVSEVLGAHEGRKHPTLRPWQTRAPSAHLPAVLDRIASALERTVTPRELVGPALSLVGRLRGVLGPLGAGGTTHRLERAALVADEAALGVLSWDNLTVLFADELGRVGFKEVFQSRKLSEAAFAAAVWDAFAGAGMPLESASLLLSPELSGVLSVAPEAALLRIAPLLGSAGEVRLSDRQWQLLLGDAGASGEVGLFRAVPAALLPSALASAARSGRPEAMAELWGRFPEQLSAQVVALLETETQDPLLSALLAQAPPEMTPRLLAALDDVEALLRAPAANLTALRRFLHTQVAERAPGFRDTYALLDEIERRCAPLRQSSLY